MDNRRTRGRWAQILSELREEDLQWVLDRFISKEVIVERCRQIVLPQPDIWGIHPYAPFRVLQQFRRRKTVPKEAYMVLMYTILETIDCTTYLKCSNNGKLLSIWIKTPSPLTDLMLDTTRVTKNGWKKTYKVSPPQPRTTFAVWQAKKQR